MKTTTSKDGTTLAYDVVGSGPALVYITGAICFRKFSPVANDVKAFAKEFTVYNYDRRGRGDSGNTLPWSLDREIEDIEAIIDAAGGKACLYGHSSGAVLALEATMRLGDKVQKTILYDASNVHDQTEKAEYAGLRNRTQALLDAGKNGAAVKNFLTEIGMSKAFIALLPLFPGWKTMKALAPTLMYDIAITGDVPPVDRAARITTPLFIMVGGKSPTALHNVADQLARAVPHAQHVVVDGQDHMVSASAVLPHLVAFLKH